MRKVAEIRFLHGIDERRKFEIAQKEWCDDVVVRISEKEYRFYDARRNQAGGMAKVLSSACSADVLSDGYPSVRVGRAANLPRPNAWIGSAFRSAADRDPICLTCRRSTPSHEAVRNLVHMLATKRSPPGVTDASGALTEQTGYAA